MKQIKRIGAVALAAAVIASLLATPAQAATWSVSLDKTNHLSRTGDTIVATIAGLPDGEGIYVRECVAAAVAGARPSTCVSIAKTVWTSLDATSTGQGATPFTGTVSVGVQSTFTAGNGTAVDCSVDACGVLVRRDHLNPTDFSLDTFVPISFAPAYSVAVSKTMDVLNAGENLSVTVAGLTTAQGIYVRICQAAATTGDRPTLCDGQGVWASVDPVMQGLGAVNADNPVTIMAKASFKSGGTDVDCTKVACGVFVRRDHIAPTDTSLDTFVPLTFTQPIVEVVDTKKISTVVNKNKVIISIVGYKGVALTFTVGTKTYSVTPTSNGFNFKIDLAKGKSATVKASQGKKLIFTKKVSN